MILTEGTFGKLSCCPEAKFSGPMLINVEKYKEVRRSILVITPIAEMLLANCSSFFQASYKDTT